MKRIESLDYLRGAMAFAVMAYHFTSWSGLPQESESILGRLGIYAVSMFYILSGLSLALVYSGRINNGADIRDFAIKRAFRIIPLFWLVISLSVAERFLVSHFRGAPVDLSVFEVFANYSFLFGFLDPSLALTTGGWSIGNEVFFYVCFPFVILLAAKNRATIPLFFAVTTAIAIYFAYSALSPGKTLNEQWPTYVNSLNQIFLFASGIAIACYKTQIAALLNKAWMSLALIGIGCLVFCLYPITGDRINLVTAEERFILSAACMVVVAAVLTFNPSFENIGAAGLRVLGESSYALYLLHPKVYLVTNAIGTKLGAGKIVIAVAAVLVTLVASWLTYRLFETFFINAGQRITARLNRQRNTLRAAKA
ncbi:acyltransferase [Pseudomonas turukhanskensis]|uniref:Acyltransferase n=2 Tax=Pseudomonas turukhanskensis TaxID=1806536 RepID=A0A9W6NET0_9PSED|nr:acyltransferase [Pseudomonas turukhanskensis]